MESELGNGLAAIDIGPARLLEAEVIELGHIEFEHTISADLGQVGNLLRHAAHLEGHDADSVNVEIDVLGEADNDGLLSGTSADRGLEQALVEDSEIASGTFTAHLQSPVHVGIELNRQGFSGLHQLGDYVFGEIGGNFHRFLAGHGKETEADHCGCDCLKKSGSHCFIY